MTASVEFRVTKIRIKSLFISFCLIFLLFPSLSNVFAGDLWGENNWGDTTADGVLIWTDVEQYVEIGQAIPCPANANCSIAPTIAPEYADSFFVLDNKIYPIWEVIDPPAIITWTDTQDATFDVNVDNVWPNESGPETIARSAGTGYSRPAAADASKPHVVRTPNQVPAADTYHIWSEQNQMIYPIQQSDLSLVIWESTDATSDPIFEYIVTDWPDNPQPHIINNQITYIIDDQIIGDDSINLRPLDSIYDTVEIVYSETDAQISQPGSTFTGYTEGHTVIRYIDSINGNPDVFEVVRSYQKTDPAVYISFQETVIGEKITSEFHDVETCGGGYIHNELSPYAPPLIKVDAPYDGYNRLTREGPIVPVNKDYSDSSADDLLITWYKESYWGSGVCWPRARVRYFPVWPTSPDEIVIASELGAAYPDDPLFYKEQTIYHQNEENKAGFNPNEEHAVIITTEKGATENKVYALRDDLNSELTSEPYTILKYHDVSDDSWNFKVYKVLAENTEYTFNYLGTAGTLIRIPYPLNLFAEFASDSRCENFNPISGPFWVDYREQVWAAAAGLDSSNDTIQVRIYEEWPNSYTGEKEGESFIGAPQCTPWLDYDGDGKGQIVSYDISWPENIPEMRIGETLIEAKNGLPDITNQCSVEVIFDQQWSQLNNPSNDSSTDTVNNPITAKLINPVAEVSVAIPQEDIPPEIKYTIKQGKWVFTDLPFHIRSRVSYDPLGNDGNGKLALEGIVDTSVIGEPMVLINILSEKDKRTLKGIYLSETDETSKWAIAINQLFDGSQNQLTNQTELTSSNKALTTGLSIGGGYMTLAMQANEDACRPLPISLEVVKVVNELHTGEIKVIENDSPFEERVILKHSNDFAGMSDNLTFEWKILADSDGTAPSYSPSGNNSNWITFNTPDSGLGQSDIAIQGSGLTTLKDQWLIVRYKGYDAVGNEIWSTWTAPQLYEGWLKRVLRGINPFEQRVSDFHSSAVNTVASMISQAGTRYEGSVALNASPDNINNVGLIELYETVLRRGMALSIDGTPAINDQGVNNALLLAAGRIADLYMLVGNEAYADAMDPTIGFGSDHGLYGPQATSLFAFQNQLDSLLEEELALLRGRDDSGASVQTQPLYNRLVWNFTSGLDGGEIAYQTNYNIVDLDEAMDMFPQAHGDAWGHYLTAIKSYYKLLRHSDYDWIPRTESVSVAGFPVNVDFKDERKFARAAAAKAKAGAEIINLTYRQVFSEDPDQITEGFKDSDTDRAWGMDGWSSRAGQGAYFDWVTGNAIIPSESTGTGIQKIDRKTVTELKEIASHFNEIQTQVDKANKGINPLGLTRDVVTFDIDPSLVSTGKTHFEQIYDRAIQTLNNAKVVFDHANQSSQQLRRQQDSLEDFTKTVDDREADFNNRLIEVFGYPYDEDIGPTGTYPTGYDGPDLFHYMYVDVADLMVEDPSDIVYEIEFQNYCEALDSCVQSSEPEMVEFNLSQNGFGHVKPNNWTARRAPGEIQLARSDLFQARARFLKGIQEYKNLGAKIEDQFELLQTQFNIQSEEIQILEGQTKSIKEINDKIKEQRQFLLSLNTFSEFITLSANATAESMPSVSGVIAGTAAGVIGDYTAPARGAIKMAAAIQAKAVALFGESAAIQELQWQQDKEILQHKTNLEIKELNDELTNQQLLAQLDELIRSEASLRVELKMLQEQISQTLGRYTATIARGMRILDDRARFRSQTADDIQDYRYEDMTFRVFRNEALQQYRAQFDLAAKYVYLAAKAYDFETNLLDTAGNSGRNFLESIIKNRTIGLIENNQPLVGQGLSDTLAKLDQNFDVLKGQLGFNNPQTETNRFSLRNELFRINQGEGSNKVWQRVLATHKVDNLWEIPEFKQFARPFAIQGEGQPGIVIPFDTMINSGFNLFGWPLGGGDSYYSPTNFSTKIRSVGVWFSNYNTLGITETPRIYIIPVGTDVLRSPNGDGLDTRTWKVVDQKIPVPYSLDGGVGGSEWIPLNDTLSDVFGDIRKFSDFRAYHDSGSYNQSEMNNDSRLIGRSVWNTKWLLIIPGASLHGDAGHGIETFIFGPEIPGGDGERTGNGITDIKIFFQTYAYSGN